MENPIIPLKSQPTDTHEQAPPRYRRGQILNQHMADQPPHDTTESPTMRHTPTTEDTTHALGRLRNTTHQVNKLLPPILSQLTKAEQALKKGEPATTIPDHTIMWDLLDYLTMRNRDMKTCEIMRIPPHTIHATATPAGRKDTNHEPPGRTTRPPRHILA